MKKITLTEIQAKITALNSDLDKIIDDGLIKDVEKYQRAYERQILTQGFDLNDNGTLKKNS